MRRALVALLAAAIALAGCRKKSEEDILKERIDATPVHLWLATKIALDPVGGDEDTKAARKALRTVIAAAQTKDAGQLEIEPSDAAALALSLWKLRGLGKEAFARNSVSIPKPFLATLVTQKGELDELLDARTEHALLLIGLTVAKVHPKLAVPIPPEILLYEAWWTDPDKVSIATFGPIARAFKAYVYGTSELCDLAQKEADKIPADGDVFSADAIAHDAELLTGKEQKVVPSDTKDLGGLVSTLANGSTAVCYVQRKEPEKATKSLRRVLDTAEAQGLKGYGVDFLRGYVECADGDAKLGEKKLKAVIANKQASKRERESAEILLSRCGQKGAMAKALDRVALGSVIALLALDYLEHSGMVDAVLATKLSRSIVGVITAAGGSVEQGKTVVPSYDDAKKGVKGWFSK